jgi:hypothetical protein
MQVPDVIESVWVVDLVLVSGKLVGRGIKGRSLVEVHRAMVLKADKPLSTSG